MENNNLDSTLDWEYMSDFYTNEKDKKVRSLEEITADPSEDKELEARLKEVNLEHLDSDLIKTIQNVKLVKEASLKGSNVEEIASQLGMDEEYVTNILMTVEGYGEDNDFAIAHLILMG